MRPLFGLWSAEGGKLLFLRNKPQELHGRAQIRSTAWPSRISLCASDLGERVCGVRSGCACLGGLLPPESAVGGAGGRCHIGLRLDHDRRALRLVSLGRRHRYRSGRGVQHLCDADRPDRALDAPPAMANFEGTTGQGLALGRCPLCEVRVRRRLCGERSGADPDFEAQRQGIELNGLLARRLSIRRLLSGCGFRR